MRKSLRALLCASAFLCLASIANAGATGDWGMAHINTIPLQRVATAPGVIDSLSFYLEGSGGTKSLAASYDTTSTIDTLSTISCSDNYNLLSVLSPAWSNKAATAFGGPDSIFVGRLTITFDQTYAVPISTDSVIVMTDISPDGTSWPYRQVALPTEGTRGLQLQVNTTSKDGSCTYVRDIWSLPPTTKIAGIESNKTICDCFGVKAIRFRLALAWSKRPLKVQSVTWSYPSTSPSTESQH